jgi:hypothetical protein
MNHLAYLGHLVSWLGILISLSLHILLGVKVGGIPLLISMFALDRQEEDQLRFWRRGLQFPISDLVLKITETLVLGGIIIALILPLFS